MLHADAYACACVYTFHLSVCMYVCMCAYISSLCIFVIMCVCVCVCARAPLYHLHNMIMFAQNKPKLLLM